MKKFSITDKINAIMTKKKNTTSEKRTVENEINDSANTSESNQSPVDEMTENNVEGNDEPASCEEDISGLEAQIAEQKDKYLRLFSEFDNFRKRTAKERIELFKTAHADLMLELLPVLDDFDRAMKSIKDAKDIESVKQGIDLIYNKFYTLLEKKGLKSMDAMGQDFDTDFHEAITEIPAPSDELKSKVVDVVEKGYTLNEKVIRYAKVVVGK